MFVSVRGVFQVPSQQTMSFFVIATSAAWTACS
jgi:hypothetical protein